MITRTSACRTRGSLLYAIGLGVLLFGPLTLPAQQPDLGEAQWRQDIAYLIGTLTAVHPAPYHRIPEAQFRTAAQSLERDLAHLSAEQVALRMMAIVALAHDGHTRLQPGGRVFRRERAFPLRIERFTDGFYVVATLPAERSLLGARVERLGGVPVQAAWDSVLTISVGDNLFGRMTGVVLLLTMPEVLTGLELSTRDSIRLDVMLASGRAATRTIPALASGAEMRWMRGFGGPANATASLPAGPPATWDLAFQNRNLPYWFVRQGNLLYAQINQTLDSRDSVLANGVRDTMSFAGLAHRIFALVDAGGIERLVLDLRYNGGGDNSLVRPFIDGIVMRPQLNRRGALFVITGRQTFSAALNFTSLLEDRTAGIFVGEPPGGSPRHYGDNTGFVLPNSKLPLRVATVTWDLGVSPTDVREVMEPDLWAPARFVDYKVGRDGALDAIRNYRDGDLMADRMRARFHAAGLDSALAYYVREKSALPTPWGGATDQLLDFAYSVIAPLDRAGVFRAFDFVTTQYPDSHVAWLANARIHLFVNDQPAAAAALARANALRPNQDLIRRLHAAVRRN